MLFDLSGLKAFVTGASGSIGSQIALNLARQGADIAISGTKLDILSQLAEEIKRETGKSAKIVLCDLASMEERNNIIEKVYDGLEGLDILVNNAGVTKDMLVMKMREEDFDFVLDINLKSAFSLSKQALAIMSRNKFGRIINISSVVAFSGNPGQANYCASKSGLIGMSKAMAIEYAKRGITINCIAPGAVSSPMLNKISDDAMEKFLAKIPVGHVGQPEDIAYGTCFLASRESSYITGQTLHVNGGMLMY